jgi:uncharacterized protein YqeY
MLVKQRREAADMFRKGDRPELADKEEAELKLIESYMPSAPTDAEMDAAIAAAIEGGPSEAGRQARRRQSAQRSRAREFDVGAKQPPSTRFKKTA